MQGGERSTSRGWTLAYGYRIPLAVFSLGVFSTVILIWTSQIMDRQEVNFEHVDAILDIRMATTAFHLWLEEATAGGSRDDIMKALPDLDAAIKLSDTLLHGGESEHGVPVLPMDDPTYRQKAERIGSLLADYRKIALRRYADPAAGGTGSALDKQCDAVFGELRETLQDLENVAEVARAKDLTQTRHLLTIAILLWTSLATAATGLLYSLERRRKRAELALGWAYQEMEQKVLNRTSDLAEANRQLQEEVTDRRLAETSLTESKEEYRRLSVQFRTVLDIIPDSISLVSPDLKVRWANRSAGVRPCGAADSLGEGPCYKLQRDGSGPCNDCPVARSFATGKAQNALISAADGRHWDMRTVPIAREDGSIESVLEVATDVTEKVALQAERMQTAHLAFIGELAAGVAHEINNPINGVINYARILCAKNGGENQAQDFGSLILKEARRIADTVRGLLLFARGGKREKTPVQIREIVSDSLGLTGSQLRKEGIEIRSAIRDDLPQVIADPQGIQQVFMNLISNARYALNQKHSGRHKDKVLEIRVEEVSLGNSRYVRTNVRDGGTGIPASLLEKVKEPFFSTKPRGRGTGLGLSISEGIITDHGGKLSIESVEGEYTNVVVDLPAGGRDNGQNSCH